ncbi:MAG TPA: O-antigen ligase family protein [Miltoncostaeaceae bacterium]|nr:O-antigen ligase family protein [Miltoncostaeaceae bacterium]
MSALRDVSVVLGALATLALLLPLGPIASARREGLRAVGAGALAAAAVLILVSLVPAEDVRSALERLRSPAAAAAAVVGLVIAVAVFLIVARLLSAHPSVWFGLLAAALPIRLPVQVGSLDANLLVPLYGLIALGLAAWVWGRIRGRIPPVSDFGPPVMTVPLAAFVAFMFLSSPWSADGQEAGIKLACFFAPFTLLYVLVVAWWPRARALGALTVVTLAGGLVAALVALWQHINGELWWNQTLIQANVYSRFHRVNGIFFDPNILGRYLALALLVGLAVAWMRTRTWELAALAGAGAVMAGGLFVSYSRSSTLMLMIGIVLLAARAAGARRVTAVAAVLLIVVGAATFAASSEVRHAATDMNRMERVSEGRFDLMRGGLTIWAKDPLLGTGLGAFAKEYEETLTETERAKIRVVISHNTPVTVLSEGGGVGFALFVALILGAGWAVVRGSLAQEGVAGWARWTAGAILLGILVHSLLYAALFEDPFIWVLAAGAVALAGGSTVAGSRAPEDPSHRSERRRTDGGGIEDDPDGAVVA